MEPRYPPSSLSGLLPEIDAAPGNGYPIRPEESIRSISLARAALLLALSPPHTRRSPHGLWVMSGGNRIVHWVPRPLRHIGCMWLDNGYEDQRCGRTVAWTLGRELSLARLYCEEHGLAILARRELWQTRKVARRAGGA